MPRRSRPEDAVAAERRLRAFELRKAGATYPEIARALGVTKQRAWQYVRFELANLAKDTRESSSEMRDLELTRLDHMQRKLWERGPGEPQIVDRVMKVMERRARLLGLDAPTKLDHTFDPTQVQSVLGFAVGGAVQMVGELRQAVLSLVADDEARSALVMVFDEREQAYVSEFEARAAAALPSGQEAAA